METNQQDFNIKKQPIPYDVTRDAPVDERLSAFEMGELWEGYLADSSAICILKYFVAKAEDPEIRGVLQYALELSTNHVNRITQIFTSVNFPIPHGFSHEDVDLNAKRLYSDGFMLAYIRNVTKYGMIKYFKSLTTSVRPDVREFFNVCIDECQSLHRNADEILIKKGFFIKQPVIPVPDRVEYIYQDASLFKGVFGDKRPMNSLEIAQVFNRLKADLIQRALLLGFSQVVQSQKIKKLFSKGKQLIDKHIRRWTKMLRDEDLAIPMSWDAEVTDSSESPFSDKLLSFHALAIEGYSVTIYGVAMASCTRTDIISAFSGSIFELQLYAKDGLDLLIDSGWLEKMPQAIDREAIINLRQ